MQIGLLLSLSVKAATTNSSAFQTTREGQSATDFHNKGFLIQADDAAFYFITLVVQLVNLEAFIKEVMGPMGVTSELGDTQCHCHLPKSCLGPGRRKTFGPKYVVDWLYPKRTFRRNSHCIYVRAYNHHTGLYRTE